MVLLVFLVKKLWIGTRRSVEHSVLSEIAAVD